MIWFADFVTENEKREDLLNNKVKNGKVRLEYHDSTEPANGSSSKLLFRCKRRMMDIREVDRLLSLTWKVHKSTAKKLIDSITKKRSTPPKFNHLGNKSSVKPNGHNCFTFAKDLLRDLNDENIKLQADSVGDFIYSATSRLLVDNQLVYERREIYKIGFGAFATGIILASVVLYLLYFLNYIKPVK